MDGLSDGWCPLRIPDAELLLPNLVRATVDSKKRTSPKRFAARQKQRFTLLCGCPPPRSTLDAALRARGKNRASRVTGYFVRDARAQVFGEGRWPLYAKHKTSRIAGPISNCLSATVFSVSSGRNRTAPPVPGGACRTPRGKAMTAASARILACCCSGDLAVTSTTPGLQAISVTTVFSRTVRRSGLLAARSTCTRARIPVGNGSHGVPGYLGRSDATARGRER